MGNRSGKFNAGGCFKARFLKLQTVGIILTPIAEWVYYPLQNPLLEILFCIICVNQNLVQIGNGWEDLSGCTPIIPILFLSCGDIQKER